MSANTAKYVIPYATTLDPVAQIAAIMQSQSNRVDLLLGESASIAAAVTANVVFSQAVVLARTYPGNATGATPGTVIITPSSAFGSGATVFWWITAWTGTATTVTGFTINLISSTTTTRTFQWRFLPVL